MRPPSFPELAVPASFAKTETSLRYLVRALRRVLTTIEEPAVADALPWPDLWGDDPEATTPPSFPPAHAEICVRAYSIAFQLLNLAEENAIAQHRRSLQDEGRLHEESGSWDEALQRAAALGVPTAQLADVLASIRVEPVLTAHPTEAKRQTVLEHHRELYVRLVQLENAMWTAAERTQLDREIEAYLERLWRTGEVYLAKPSLDQERRYVLHYLRGVFPRVLPWVDAHLRGAWERAGHDPGWLDRPAKLPRLVFGDWVGGDRDGHPGVTAEVTRETLALFRRSALELIDEHLTALAQRVSLSSLRQPIPDGLVQRVQALRQRLGDAGQTAMSRNPGEPFRQHVNLLRAALPFSDAPGVFESSDALRDELDALATALEEVGATRLARVDVDPLIRLVETFSFHLATLDIRQNSGFHDRALAQLLALAGVEDGERWAEWDLPRRRTLLERELATRRPFAPAADVEGAEARAVLEAYGVLADHRAVHGDRALGALIVSMTRSAEDLLAVYVLAREGGLLVRDGDGVYCPLEVVPLFETIDDLARAPRILDDYLGHPIVQASLQHRQRREGTDVGVQQVMVGYSDSGKDGGITASMWNLYRGQQELAEVGRRHGVRVRFFHGRGGTIGRGAGPTHRFVAALPRGTVGGDLRLTEQGETISQKYANKVTAAHHLELLLAGTFRAAVEDAGGREAQPALAEILERLAADSRDAYRGLLEADGFIPFFRQATPIDAIETCRIGSRPARRTGQASLADLRAIPWVFAWNQSRFVLPGWYGLGSALDGLRHDDPDAFEAIVVAKREETRWAPVHYLISNAATAFMTSSRELMAKYAELVEDADVRDRLLKQVLEEHTRTGEVLQTIYGDALGTVRWRIDRVLTPRRAALGPLHHHQIELLRRWREAHASGQSVAADALLPQLLLTINAIAAGLGATG